MTEQKQSEQNENTVNQESIFTEIYDLKPYEKTLRNARIWLYVISGLQFIMGIFEYNTIPDKDFALIAFGIDAFVALIFLVLALWSRKSPIPAFTIALAFYLLIHIGLAFLDVSTIKNGIIFKIFVVIALVKANRDARKYEEMKALSGS